MTRRRTVLLTCLTMAAFAAGAHAVEKWIYHPTAFHVIEASFEETYGQNFAVLDTIANAELDILQAAGVDAIFAPSPRTLGNRRKRFDRVANLAMNRGFKLYMPTGHELRTFDEFDATNEFSNGQYLSQAAINYTGIYIDEPMVNNRASWETTQMAMEAKDRGRPVLVVFGGSKRNNYHSFLYDQNLGTAVSGHRLIDYVDILAVDDYPNSSSRAFEIMAAIAINAGKQFMGILGETYKQSKWHLNGQYSQALSLGAQAVALWTMDGIENGTVAARFDQCTSPSYRLQFGTTHGGGGNYYVIECFDYGELVYRSCSGPPEPNPGGDCDVFSGGNYEWGFKTIVDGDPNGIWAWWANL